MLTKNDLNQIRGIVKEEIEPVQKDVGILKEDIGTLKKDVGVLKQDVGTLKKDVSVLKRDASKLKRDQGTMLDLLDREQMHQRKRITRLEEHSGLQSPQ